MKRVIVLDTNVFINDPEVLKKIPSTCAILISDAVTGELEKKLYTTSNTSEMAIKITEAFKIMETLKNIKCVSLYDNRYLAEVIGEKNLRINHFVNDDIILATALQFREFNPLFITNDNELLGKCKKHGIECMKIRKFYSFLKIKKECE